MNWLSELGNNIGATVEGFTNTLSGKGPRGLGASNINAGAFQDPNLERNKKLLEAQRQASLAAGTQGLSGQTQLAGQQQQLIGQMQARAAGQSPSIAELQLQQAKEANRQSLASQAASQRGVGAGLAQRNMARAQAGSEATLAGQAALLRAQEQQQAEQSLAGLLGQTRGQEQNLMNVSNDLALEYMRLGLSQDQAQFLANQKLEEMRQNARTAQAEAGIKQQAGILGGLSTIGAALL